jgi:5'-nucleotidase
VISSETHAVIEKRARNIIVSRDIPKDSGVVELVNEYKCLVAPTADKVIGNITGNITVEPNDSGESALCDLIADAQLYNTSNPNYGGAVAAFTNPEGIRSSLNLSGSKLPCNVTYGEAFSVQPFGNNLVTMTLSGTQIDALLEQQFDNTSFGNKGVLLQVSKGSSYTWNKSAPVGKKVNISSIKINGTSIDPRSLYRVTVDGFMVDGGNNLSVLKAGVNRTLGSLDDINITANYFTDSSPVAPGHRDHITVVK